MCVYFYRFVDKYDNSNIFTYLLFYPLAPTLHTPTILAYCFQKPQIYVNHWLLIPTKHHEKQFNAISYRFVYFN